jgi:putative phosphoribosyl transferase
MMPMSAHAYEGGGRIMWTDRREAGRELAEELRLRGYGDREDVLVLGVPRGGVEVAAEVARTLGAPLDIVVVRKIGAPGNPEFAAGAVDADGHVYANPDARASSSYLEQEGRREQAEALRRIEEYRDGRPEPAYAGRTVIVADDGIATGLTALACVKWLRTRGAAKVVLAIPVMSRSAERMLRPEVDELVALEVPAGFYAVGAHYARFGQLTDADVKSLLTGATV